MPFRLSRAHKIYKELFGQVEDLIKGKDLLIVPSGPLTQLPFQVLVTEEPDSNDLTRAAFTKAAWLADRHAITVLPSVSSLKALRAHAKASTASKPFVGFGNPILDGNAAAAKLARTIKGCAGSDQVRTAQLRTTRTAVLPLGRGTRLADLKLLKSQVALPETADEICAVARGAGANQDDVFLGHNATEARIKALSTDGRLSQYKILHFATHGALAGELKGSNEPGLIFTPPKSATPMDDGYLSASEIAGLKLNADWVILSACNTAGGETQNAEALSGMAKAFFYAGARSLLVSHWYVNSLATVSLITMAFDALKRDPKIGRAEALRRAMLSLMRSGKRTWHPAYWAPFVLVGEGAEIAPPDHVQTVARRASEPSRSNESSITSTGTHFVFGVAADDVLNVRSGPSPRHTIAGKIPPRSRGIQMTANCVKSWCPIRYKDISGYVYRSFIKPEAGRVPNRFRVVDVAPDDKLNLRRSPDVKSKVLFRIPPNARDIEIVGRCKARWCPVDYRSVQGWVHQKHLRSD